MPDTDYIVQDEDFEGDTNTYPIIYTPEAGAQAVQTTQNHINSLVDAKVSNFATLDQVKAQVAESIGELDDLVTALEEVV